MDRSIEEENQTNKTKSIDIQTSNYGDYSDQSSLQIDEDQQEQDVLQNEQQSKDIDQKQPDKIDQQQQFTSSKNLNESNQDMRIRDDTDLESEHDINQHQNMQNVRNLEMAHNQKIKGEVENNKNKSDQHKEQAQQVHTLANDPAFAISDKKVWAVQGIMPGSVSKKFIRSYKLGRYNKVKSLKQDMEYFNSPHHEQLHLGNNIFPFQNNKNRIHTIGSFDYRKYTQPSPVSSSLVSAQYINTSAVNKGMTVQKQNNTFGITGMSEKSGKSKKKEHPSAFSIFSPRTTSNTVIQQVIQSNNGDSNRHHFQQQQMEIRYIDIISQPIVKSTHFINNSKCPHSLTNLRSNEKKNIFFFNNVNNNSSSNNNNSHYKSNNNHNNNKHLNVEYLQPQFPPKSNYQNQKIHSIGVEGGGETNDTFQEFIQNRKYGVNDFFGEETIYDNDNINQYYQYNEHHGNNPVPKQNIVFQPKPRSSGNTLNQHHRHMISSTSEFLSTVSPQTPYTTDSAYTKKLGRTQSNIKSTYSISQPRLPLFATNPENISFFPKAKSNLVKYVNQIGVQENPLRNTFVTRKNHF